ncbi:hypothetical protein NKH98_11875 [Mesorhizobium sp. M0833]|uniref:hypothetical protein n=1 Tax=Mesorhizobium sp. M0833 TaxID=2957009 RepID=UPI003334B040
MNDRDRAMRSFDHLSFGILVVEPTAEEIELAAAYEAQAQELDLQLDSGESQLLAILVSRGCKLFLTGDKRAIVAIEEIVGHEFAHPPLACLEQVVAAIMAATNVAYMRSRVCAEPNADRAMSICFSCAATAVSIEAAVEGLNSHINALRSRAARTLLASNDLSGLVA